MKKCEQFKELILTEYIDGEMGKESVGQLENHLMDCQGCRAFLKEVKSHAKMPVLAVQEVPSELWDAVKQGIEEQNQRVSPLDLIREALQGFLVLPRLVPIAATLTLMLLVGSVTLDQIHLQTKAQDQGQYLISLLTPAEMPSENDTGTPLEHYFL